MKAIRNEGFILRRFNYRETSVLLDLFTRESGRFRGLLKGARQPRGRIPPLCFTPGSRVEVLVYPRRSAGLALLSSPVLVEHFDAAASGNLRAWHLVLQMVNTFCPDLEPSAGVFSLLETGQKILPSRKFPGIVYVALKERLIRHLGYGIELARCVRCRRETASFLFSGKLGGILCPSCGREDPNSRRISRKIVALLNHVGRFPGERLTVIRRIPPDILERVNGYLNAILYYHTDVPYPGWKHEKSLFQEDT